MNGRANLFDLEKIPHQRLMVPYQRGPRFNLLQQVRQGLLPHLDILPHDAELQKKLLLSGLQRRQKATIEPQLLLLLAQRNLVELDSFRHTAQLTAVSFLGQCLSMNSCLIPTSFGWKHSARVAQPRSRASLIPMSTWRSINRS